MNINYTQKKPISNGKELINNININSTPLSPQIISNNLFNNNLINYSYSLYFMSLLSSSLLIQKHALKENQYALMKINNIIYGKKSHMVAVFKDMLLTPIESELIKRYYESEESRNRIKAYSDYYKNYLEYFCRPLFNEYYHNNVMVYHYERHAQFYYNNQYSMRKLKDNKRKVKSKHRNADEAKTIFSESLRNNLNKDSLSTNNSRIILNSNKGDGKSNKHKEYKEELITSLTNWSFIAQNNIQMHSDTLDQLFTNESIVSCIYSNNYNNHPSSLKEASNHANPNCERNKFRELKTIKVKEIMKANAKPVLQVKESKLRNKKEQFQFFLNKIIRNGKERECPNLIMKNLQLKNAISVKSIHHKIPDDDNQRCNNNKNNKDNKCSIDLNTIENIRHRLVLSHINSFSRIPKLSIEVCDNINGAHDKNSNAKGRNKQKQVIFQPKELIITTTHHNKNHHSNNIKKNTDNNIKPYANTANKSQALNKKIFLHTNNFNPNSNPIHSEQDNDILLNTRNKNKIEPLQLIPQISHNNILKSLSNNRSRIAQTLQKTPIGKPDIFQAYFKKDKLNGMSLKGKESYYNLTNNSKLKRFNSETFFHLSSSSSMPKNNSIKVKPKNLKLKIKK